VGELCERTATLLTETAQRNVHDRWVKPAWQVI